MSNPPNVINTPCSYDEHLAALEKAKRKGYMFCIQATEDYNQHRVNPTILDTWESGYYKCYCSILVRQHPTPGSRYVVAEFIINADQKEQACWDRSDVK